MYYVPKFVHKLKLTSKRGCTFSDHVKICGGCQLLNARIGRYTYIGYDTAIVNTEIGAFSSIAANCIIGGGEHPINYVSTSPLFHAGKNIFRTNFAKHDFDTYKKTVIGNDVWIAHAVSIKGGVTIADGAIIGMGSVVTKDIGPYEIWAGNPAKLIKKRFGDEQIMSLMAIKWWDMSYDEIKKYSANFDDVDRFIEFTKKETYK